MAISSCILTFLILIFTTGISSAAPEFSEYKSELGYKILVPGNWLILNRQIVTEDPDLKSYKYLLKMRPIDIKVTNLIEEITYMEMIKSGHIEYIFNADTAIRHGSKNADIISVFITKKHIPTSPNVLKEFCRLVKSANSVVHQCDVIQLKKSGKKCLFVDSNGSKKGVRSLQWLIQKNQLEAFMITANIHTQTLTQSKSAAEDIINSLEIY